MNPVTDPAILQELEGGLSPIPQSFPPDASIPALSRAMPSPSPVMAPTRPPVASAPAALSPSNPNPQPVTDPDLIRQLEQADAPSQPQPIPNLEQRTGILGRSLLGAAENVFHGAAQGTDPNPGDRPMLGAVTMQDDAGNYYFKGRDGQPVKVNLATQNLLRDPTTGSLSVYAHDPAYDESGLKGAGRIISQGLVTSPITGPAQSVALNVPRAAQMAQATDEGFKDLQAIKDLGVTVPGVAFASGPTRGIAKGLSDIPLIGAPMRNAIEDSYTSLKDAVDRTADAMSPVDTADRAGYSLQTALDRFRNASTQDIEPGILENLGIDPRAPVPPADIMSKQAAQRMAQAAPIRDDVGGIAARTRNNILTARRGVDDMSDQELNTLINTPADQTSFRARAEALYENAYRAIPTQMRSDNSVNPQRLSAVNLRNTLGDIDNQIGSQIGGQGTLTGDLADRLRNPQSHLSFDDLRQIRTQLGEALSGSTEQTLSNKQLRALYGATSQDMEVGLQDLANRAYINSQQPPASPSYVPIDVAQKADAALDKFRTADRYYRSSQNRMDKFSSVVDANNPEQAVNRLVQAANDGSRGNWGLVRSAMGVLRPEEQADLSSYILRNMGTPPGSARGISQETNFSPSQLVTRLNNMDPRAFNAMFPGEHGETVRSLLRASSRLANIEALANTSRSGTTAVGLGGLAATAAALAHGAVAGPLAIGATGLGLSTLLSRPAYANWALKMMQLKTAAARSPGSVTGQIASHINRLAFMSQRDPQLRPIVSALASENGVGEGSPDNQQPDQNVGP